MKEKKTANDLHEMNMQEVSKHPDWNIVDVVITQTVQEFPHHPNWQAAFRVGRPGSAPAEAYQFARELAAKFDLA
jgi:hypothetical protein